NTSTGDTFSACFSEEVLPSAWSYACQVTLLVQLLDKEASTIKPYLFTRIGLEKASPDEHRTTQSLNHYSSVTRLCTFSHLIVLRCTSFTESSCPPWHDAQRYAHSQTEQITD